MKNEAEKLCNIPNMERSQTVNRNWGAEPMAKEMKG